MQKRKLNFINKENYFITDKGNVFNMLTGKQITPILKNGYAQVRLSKRGKISNYSLHRLVYEAFFGKIGEYQINHINGIRNDNRIDNLEKVTPEDNNKKRLFQVRGEQVNTCKLTSKQVIEIRKAKSEGMSTKDLTKKYKVSKTTINRIARGKNWKHLDIFPVNNVIWGNPKITGSMSRKVLEERYGKEYWSKIAKGNHFKKHCKTCSCNL